MSPGKDLRNRFTAESLRLPVLVESYRYVPKGAVKDIETALQSGDHLDMNPEARLISTVITMEAGTPSIYLRMTYPMPLWRKAFDTTRYGVTPHVSR